MELSKIKMDKRKMRDYLFKGGIIAVFLVVMYYILFDSSSEASEKNTSGLIMALPEGKAEPLKDKMKAYESAPLMENNDKRMKTLNDYVFSLKNEENKETPLEEDGDDRGYKVDIEETQVPNSGTDALQRSLEARYAAEEIEREYYHVQDENDRLRRELREMEEKLRRKENAEETERLMQQSYRLSSEYREAGASKDTSLEKDAETSEKEDDDTALEVTKKEGDVVSTLSDEVMLNKPYNYGFITAVGESYVVGTNTIRAAISEDQTVTAGDRVKLRLLEPFEVGGTTIPRNHLLSGTVRMMSDRMDIRIETIEYRGNVLPVSLKVYDTDGIPGIYCPGSAELDALKEGAANLGSGIGSSISFTHSAGQQVAMDLARGAMSGVSGYLSKKLRTVRVTLKSNYEVLLLPSKK